MQPGPLLLNEESQHLLDVRIDRTLEEIEGSAPLLARMIRFHLGLIDSAGTPTTDDERRGLQGKRLRPAIAMLAAESVGGSAAVAAPLAAAIELLHNFTLIHDDIQDRSPNRRHRATVWRIWGDAQAINAGDALFAASHLTLLDTPLTTISADSLIELTREFNRTTTNIVRGQVLDIGFEGRSDVTPEQYLEMISGKTAAIVSFAARGGALVGGTDATTADLFAEFGQALGIGFQIRDDLLGIWGEDSATGKTRGDDIRRRKQSLPILLLRSRASGEDTKRLDALYASDEIADGGLQEVLAMLDQYRIRDEVEAHIEAAHQRANRAFESIRKTGKTAGNGELSQLIHRLERRES